MTELYNWIVQLLRIRLEIEIPKAASNEVLIKVHAAGINPVDTYIRAGQYIPSRLPALPYTPGGDVCGEVVEVGSDVSEFSIGDKGKVWPLLWLGLFSLQMTIWPHLT